MLDSHKIYVVFCATLGIFYDVNNFGVINKKVNNDNKVCNFQRYKQ